MSGRTLLLVAWCAMAGACSETTGTPTSPSTDPTTFTFSTALRARSSVSRSFDTASAGTISMKLVSVTPPVPVGFGIGIPRADGSGCDLTSSGEASGDAQVDVVADSGKFCVKVFDSGYVPNEISFSITVTHP